MSMANDFCPYQRSVPRSPIPRLEIRIIDISSIPIRFTITAEFWPAVPLGEVEVVDEVEPVETELGAEVIDDGDIDDVEPEEEGAVVEDVDEDVVDGRGEKESDTLGLATLQNCCASDSADARSPIHCFDTQLVMSSTKLAALYTHLRTSEHASRRSNLLSAEAVHISNTVTAHLRDGDIEAIRYY